MFTFEFSLDLDRAKRWWRCQAIGGVAAVRKAATPNRAARLDGFWVVGRQPIRSTAPTIDLRPRSATKSEF
jgi:hypothetical protein